MKLRVILGLGLAALLLGVYGCVAVRLPNVPLKVRAETAEPAVLGPFAGDPAVADAAAFAARRAPALREAFQAHIYGRFPAIASAVVESKAPLASPAGPAVAMEQWRVKAGPAGFSMLVLLPAKAKGPTPIVIMQNFCGNAAVFPKISEIDAPRHGGPAECGSGAMGWVVPLIFGDAIMMPPVTEILGRGYGLAMMYGGDIAPDSAEASGPFLAALTPPGVPADQRTGAVAAWAWGYLAALDALSADPRIKRDAISLWGHSRNGKAALLAAAMDPRPAAVIALQPGTAGGSLGRDEVGESIAQITESYPHWFAPAYQAYAGRQSALPVDQHQLLALIAPRPVLLGAARRDRWSDPQGAFRAAQAAAPAYAAFVGGAFAQKDLRKPDFAFPLATYMRPGLHGVHGSDWKVALDFLDARLKR